MGTSESPLIYHLTFYLTYLHPPGKPGLSSRRAKTVMVTSMRMIFSDRSTRQSTSLKVSPRAGLRASFYLTMHPAIKSVHQTRYLHEIW
jgi:hypothetical protein